MTEAEIKACTCPHCGARHGYRTDQIGVPFGCPACGGAYVVREDGQAVPAIQEQQEPVPSSMSCPACGAAFQFEPSMAGGEFECPTCQCQYTVNEKGRTKVLRAYNKEQSTSLKRAAEGAAKTEEPSASTPDTAAAASGPKDSAVSARQKAAERRARTQRLAKAKLSKVSQSLTAMAKAAVGEDEQEEDSLEVDLPTGGQTNRTRSSTRIKTQSSRRSRSTSSVRRGKGGVGDISPALTTGEGTRAGKAYRNYAIAGLILGLVVVAFVFWIQPNPMELALRQVTNVKGLNNSRIITSLENRSPLGAHAVEPIIGMESPSFGPVIALDIGALDFLRGAKQLVPKGVWVTSDFDLAKEALSEGSNDEDAPSLDSHKAIVTYLKSRGVDALLHEDVERTLIRSLGEENGRLMADLLTGPIPVKRPPRPVVSASSTSPSQIGRDPEMFREHFPQLGQQLEKGLFPTRIEIVKFSGSQAILLMPFGDPLQTAYVGSMIRITDADELGGYDGSWHLATLKGP